MPLDTPTTAPEIKLRNARVAQRCVDEWLIFLADIDRRDTRRAPAVAEYRQAVKLRNRLERDLVRGAR